MYMNQYQAARVSFVLKPDLSQQWLNNVIMSRNKADDLFFSLIL